MRVSQGTVCVQVCLAVGSRSTVVAPLSVFALPFYFHSTSMALTNFYLSFCSCSSLFPLFLRCPNWVAQQRQNNMLMRSCQRRRRRTTRMHPPRQQRPKSESCTLHTHTIAVQLTAKSTSAHETLSKRDSKRGNRAPTQPAAAASLRY